MPKFFSLVNKNLVDYCLTFWLYHHVYDLFISPMWVISNLPRALLFSLSVRFQGGKEWVVYLETTWGIWQVPEGLHQKEKIILGICNDRPTSLRTISHPKPTCMTETQEQIKTNGCLYPDCKDPVQTRGLCRNHYSIARWLVAIRKTTWKEMESTGKVLPSVRGRSFSAAKWFLETNSKITSQEPVWQKRLKVI